MADSTLPLQAAIVAALKADAGVSAVVGARVYDRAPDDAAHPFISLGAENAEPWEGSELSGWDVEWQIDTWSQSPGRVEVRRVMAAVYGALHRQTLAVEGQQFVLGSLTYQTTMGDPDGVTTHGVQRFRFVTHL